MCESALVRRKTTLKKKTTGVYREGSRDQETRHRHDKNRWKVARGESQKEVHDEETKESGWKRRTQRMKNESSFWERGNVVCVRGRKQVALFHILGCNSECLADSSNSRDAGFIHSNETCRAKRVTVLRGGARGHARGNRCTKPLRCSASCRRFPQPEARQRIHEHRVARGRLCFGACRLVVKIGGRKPCAHVGVRAVLKSFRLHHFLAH